MKGYVKGMYNQKRNLGKVFCEIICLALAFCMVFGIMPLYAETGADMSEGPKQVVVMKQNVRKGAMLADIHLEVKTLAEGETVPENAITDITQAKAKYAKYALYEGEYLQKDQISSQKVSAANTAVLKKPIDESDDAYVVVTDYIEANTEKDLSGALQELIDKNPNRTIYFPDGVYMIAKPLLISGMARESVSLELSDGAVIKAATTWKPTTIIISTANRGTREGTSNALITIGMGNQDNNDIKPVGSYFGIKGGTLDGNGRADGIVYAGGRESLIRNICIKNVTVGIKIEYGVNSGSSDADFEDITIYGDLSKANTKGIDVEGHDNTFTNIRIYDMHTGIECTAGSSLYKNIYMEITDPANKALYAEAKAFYTSTWSWLSQCTAKNYKIAYEFKDSRSIVSDCIAIWNDEACTEQIVFNRDAFPVGGIRVEFFTEGANTAFFTGSTNKPVIDGCFFDESLEDNGSYKSCTNTDIIPLS